MLCAASQADVRSLHAVETAAAIIRRAHLPNQVFSERASERPASVHK